MRVDSKHMNQVWVKFQSNDQIYWFLTWLNRIVPREDYEFSTTASENPYCYLFTFRNINRDEFAKCLLLYKLSSLEPFVFREFHDRVTDEFFIYIKA